MGVLEMKLIFSNPEKKYFSGETISGRLVIHSRESVTLRNITITFQGKAKTYWTEDEDSYGGCQKYFKNHIVVYGGKGYNEELPPGEHCFTFQMLLPEHIPSSFKGGSGRVRYKVKANIDRPQWPDSYVLEELQIISPIDLNSNPEYKHPLTVETNKNFWCCCCESGPLTVVSKINRRGFMAGDVVNLTVEVDNASDVGINTVSYELQRAIIYYTNKRRSSTKENKVILKEVLGGPLGRRDSKVWNCKIKLPEISPPSFLKTCDIIDLDYRLQVKARPIGAHLDLINDIPIVIGTIPINQDALLS